MTVFKNYFKIVSKHLGLIIMYASISIVVSIINSRYTNTYEDYVPSSPDIAIINHDKSLLTDNFTKYMEENANIVLVGDSKEEMQDALYYSKVDAILIIPKDYTKDFLLGNDPKIEIKESIENTSVYIKLLTNRYFKIAGIYNNIGMNEREIVNSVNLDIEKEASINIINENKASKLENLALFYNFENYAFLSIIIFVVGTIMCIFNNDNIRKRNLISKLNQRSFNNQLFLGHVSLTLLLWLIFTIISIIIYGNVVFTANGMLMVFNSLIFIITITSMAYLIGSLIKNKNIISGIINVIGLGLSFISGCFVPLSFLDSNIVNFSKLFPSYWYIKNNNYIMNCAMDSSSLEVILKNICVIIIMGIIYFAISKIVSSKRQKLN